MSMRLDITVFGTFYSVGAILLTAKTVRAGIKAFGEKKWNEHIINITLHDPAGKLKDKISHTIGLPLPVVYTKQGIALHDTQFGIEAFYGGHHLPLSVVEAENRTLQPSRLMQMYESGDMLGVFRTSRDGAMFFRWDEVDGIDPEEVVVAYDNLAKLIPGVGAFDLAFDITWRGKKGRRPELRSEPFSGVKHIFHKVN